MSDLRDVMRETSTSNDLVAVDVPEWDRKVYIRKLSVREGFKQTNPDPKMAGLLTLIGALVDENGEQLLSEDDLELVLDQPLAIIVPLLTEVGRQNGFTGKEVDEAMQAFRNAQS